MANLQDFSPREAIGVVNIATGQSLSGYIDLFGCSLVGIVMPAAWTAASITFQTSPYDPSDPNFTQWNEFWKSTGNNDGFEYQIATAAAVQGQTITIPEGDFAGVRFLKVRSGAFGAGVVQTRANGTNITLICRPVT